MPITTNDETGPLDHDELDDIAALDAIEAEVEARILAKSDGQPTGCLFPNEHDPRHPVSMRFHVSMDDAQGRATPDGWEDLTEREILLRLKAVSMLVSSQFHFWWDD